LKNASENPKSGEEVISKTAGWEFDSATPSSTVSMYKIEELIADSESDASSNLSGNCSGSASTNALRMLREGTFPGRDATTIDQQTDVGPRASTSLIERLAASVNDTGGCKASILSTETCCTPRAEATAFEIFFSARPVASLTK